MSDIVDAVQVSVSFVIVHVLTPSGQYFEWVSFEEELARRPVTGEKYTGIDMVVAS